MSCPIMTSKTLCSAIYKQCRTYQVKQESKAKNRIGKFFNNITGYGTEPNNMSINYTY